VDHHFVYIFRVNGLCKIGRTNNPDRRKVQLQTAIPYPIETVCLIQTTRHGLERALHRRFDHLKARGEWYALTDTEIQWIKDFANNPLF
jgi:hypothetical protein